MKFLGITLDKSLNFNTHFQKTYKEALYGLRGFILAKNVLTYKAKCSIYHSLIRSSVEMDLSLKIEVHDRTICKSTQEL